MSKTLHLGNFFLVAVAILLAESDVTISTATATDPNLIKIPEVASRHTARSLSARDHIAPRRSLRIADIGDADNTPGTVSTARNDEERAIVSKADLVSALRISEGDAKILRGILKGRSPDHILDKMGVGYLLTNTGQRLYSKYGKAYQNYLFYVKYARDHLPDGMYQQA